MGKETTISVTPEIAEYLSGLMKRDTAEMAGTYYDGQGRDIGLKCPECGKLIGRAACFCAYCGQRLDAELMQF